MILVVYATKHGSTREVAEAVAETLRDEGLDVEVREAAETRSLDRYDGVVLGGALYMGRWHRDAKRFLSRHRAALATMPVAVFAMGPRTLEEQDVAESRTQLDRALAEAPELEPVSVAIFGGVIDPAAQHFPFNRMAATDARDWDAIRAWARELARSLAVPA
ncbi:MAG TPA: flavodoxin domain-containing protein [Gaiellaceae bacterium]|nr:flavodoxin domain-containing protein [Gaiellaceae bacterium]